MKSPKLAPELLAEKVQALPNLKLKISNNMVTYGGSFVKALGEALMHADNHNTYKLVKTWPIYIEQYLPENWEEKA